MGRLHRQGLASALVVCVMAVGSVALWIGIPFGWLWVGSQLAGGTQPRLGPLVLVLLAIPLSMLVAGKALGRLDDLHGRLSRSGPRARARTPWLRSMRGERDARRPGTVLDTVMVVSVGAALLVFGVWFLFFAQGGGLPG